MKISLKNIAELEYEYVMRAIRNDLLKESDWTQLPDATVDREAWARYRQALRDFPATWTPSPTADFPDTP
jgi:hypothetical protein